MDKRESELIEQKKERQVIKELNKLISEVYETEKLLVSLGGRLKDVLDVPSSGYGVGASGNTLVPLASRIFDITRIANRNNITIKDYLSRLQL